MIDENNNTPKKRVSRMTDNIGNIDGLFGNYLSGWYFDCSNNDEPATLAVYKNGVFFQNIICDRERPDVFNKLGYARESGFFIDLTQLEYGAVHEIALVDKSCNFTFHDRKILFCKEVHDHLDGLRNIFVEDYYKSKNGLLGFKNNQAFDHYINQGIYQGLSPCAWYNDDYVSNQLDKNTTTAPSVVEYLKQESQLNIKPCSEFDPANYLKRNPDLNANMGLLYHYVQHGRYEGRDLGIHSIPKSIQDELVSLSKIEPRLSTIVGKTDYVVRYSVSGPGTYIAENHENTFGDDIDIVICVPFISIGGADLVATHVLKAYQEEYGVDRVLLMVTDSESLDVPEWLADGSKISLIGKDLAQCDGARKLEIFHNTISRLSPRKIFNINSSLAWKLTHKYGAQLSKYTDLHAYLFCFDFNNKKMPVGYLPDYLPTTLKHHKRIFCDNHEIIENIKTTYGFFDSDLEKLKTVYIPGVGRENRIEHQPINDASILWVGRLCEQKRPDLLVEIAKRLPNQKFSVYGVQGNSAYSQKIINGEYSNIEFKGQFSDICTLDFDSHKFLLNTSEWEGLPTLLIRLMDIGLPIVTSNAGGISEIVNADTGHLVENMKVDSFIKAIVSASLSPEKNQQMVKNGFEIIDSKHSWTSFVIGLRDGGAFATHSEQPLLAVCA